MRNICDKHYITQLYNIFSLSETYEQKRQEHTAELLKKEEEMRQTFVIKVKEKESELKEAEREVIQFSYLFEFNFFIIQK